MGREGSVGTFLIDTNSDEACQLPGRGLFFPEITHSVFLMLVFMIPMFVGHEKNAQRDLEKGAPSFTP